MLLGIDGGTWGNRRGYGRFTRELVKALAATDSGHAWALFLDPFTSRDEVPGNVEVITVRTTQAPSEAASATGRRSIRDIWAMSRAIRARGVEAIVFPSVYTFVPVLDRRVKSIVGIHDAIAERFPQLVFGSRRARLFWTMKVRAAVSWATRLFTVSDYARAALAAHFGIDADRFAVVPEAPAPAFRPVADEARIAAACASVGVAPGTRTVMYFGGISPHKNIGMLVDVFSDLSRDASFSDVRLLIVGDYTHDVFYSAYPALRARVAAQCPGAVIFTGPVDDARAACLLSVAQVLVLPSFDEGFGLPGVEAAACGAPVIATRSSALPDVLGDAAIYIDPAAPESLKGALVRVLESRELRTRMAALGLQRAAALSWRQSAVAMLAIIEGLPVRPL